MKTEIFFATQTGGAAERLPRRSSVPRPTVAEKRPLLLLSEDKVLGWNLLMAASRAGRKLVRAHPAANGPQMLQVVQPEAVLLDLDLAEEAAWAAADSLLQDEECPPLILLTSNADQADFDTAVQAGFLIPKTTHPAKLLELIERKIQSTKAVQREQNAIQRIVVRWLKPYGWSVRIASQKRFWGINE
jgi:CheY-like chemotaxis protein